MNYLDELKNKRSRSDLERAVLYVSDPQKYDIHYIDPDQAAAELARFTAAKTLLKKLEWSGSDELGAYCPSCHGYKADRPVYYLGHSVTCELAAALKE